MNEYCDRHESARALSIYVKPSNPTEMLSLSFCGHCDVLYGPELERQGFTAVHEDEIKTEQMIDEIINVENATPTEVVVDAFRAAQDNAVIHDYEDEFPEDEV